MDIRLVQNDLAAASAYVSQKAFDFPLKKAKTTILIYEHNKSLWRSSPGSPLADTISLMSAAPAKTYTAEQIAAESKRANEFFDKNFDEFVARHPQFASQLGIKSNYDKWEDLSDAADAADLAFALKTSPR